jgi:hypothetical protein
VTLGHQQYLGFKALAAAPQHMTVEQAADFLAENSGFSRGPIIENAPSYRTAYRQAAARLHPDVTGGNDGFYKLSAAKTILDQHHELKVGGRA